MFLFHTNKIFAYNPSTITNAAQCSGFGYFSRTTFCAARKAARLDCPAVKFLKNSTINNCVDSLNSEVKKK